jgi:hypothetical protein
MLQAVSSGSEDIGFEQRRGNEIEMSSGPEEIAFWILICSKKTIIINEIPISTGSEEIDLQATKKSMEWKYHQDSKTVTYSEKRTNEIEMSSGEM